ncbi:MAG: hypothetical protein QXS54_09525, partial [Candidatus Methanomethylicaceae archaeon]
PYDETAKSFARKLGEHEKALLAELISMRGERASCLYELEEIADLGEFSPKAADNALQDIATVRAILSGVPVSDISQTARNVLFEYWDVSPVSQKALKAALQSGIELPEKFMILIDDQDLHGHNLECVGREMARREIKPTLEDGPKARYAWVVETNPAPSEIADLIDDELMNMLIDNPIYLRVYVNDFEYEVVNLLEALAA